MSNREIRDREQFAEILSTECGDSQKGQRAARLLLRHGKTYARIQESNCNGVGTYYNEDPKRFAVRQAKFEAAIEKKESLLESRMRAIVAELGSGFGVTFNGDPRGSTVKVTVPSGRTNDWGREGICVPSA
jgi:hypothetical protein